MEINDNDKEINSAWHVHEDGTVHAHHGHTHTHTKIILQDHIEHCLVEAVKENDQEAIDKLKEAIDKFVK